MKILIYCSSKTTTKHIETILLSAFTQSPGTPERGEHLNQETLKKKTTKHSYTPLKSDKEGMKHTTPSSSMTKRPPQKKNKPTVQEKTT